MLQKHFQPNPNQNKPADNSRLIAEQSAEFPAKPHAGEAENKRRYAD
jgi:hypothetical protein